MINRYSLPQFEKIWSVQSKYENWLTIESIVLQIMEQFAIVPKGVADKCAQIKIDVSLIEEIETKTRHDFVAFLQYVELEMGDDGRWVHYGLTSSDIVDTAFSLNLVLAGEEINKLLGRVIDAFIPLIEAYDTFPMMGRTHGMHAEPITVGLFFARHLAEFKRNRERLCDAINHVSVGKLSGAVGTYAHFSPKIEALALSRMGLKPILGATQVIPRDVYATYFMTLSLIAVAIERFALNIRHLHRSEISEIQEGFKNNQKGSSAMPHKRNPITCENLCGLSRYVRGMITPVIENCALWHERDISHSSVERITAPDMTTVVGFMLNKTEELILGLEINKTEILKPLDTLNVYGEYVLLELVKAGMSRKQAHNIVQRVVTSKQSLLLVLYEPEVQKLIQDGAITEDQIRHSIGVGTRPQDSQNIKDIINSIIN